MRANYCDSPEHWEEARELTDEEMENLTYVENREYSYSRSFKAELAQRIESGSAKTGMFATTEF